MDADRYAIDDLLRVMQRLRDPEHGCPWDLRQTFQSIVPSTLEECYELAATIESGDYPHMAEELGDVLFQVVFYSQLGREQGLFSFESVVDSLVEKLVRRHPHVFADGTIEGVVGTRESLASVAQSWEAIKQSERKRKNQAGLLADVPLALPALPRAQKLQKRAAQAGFDWENVAGVLDKLSEEVAELRSALAEGNEAAIGDELGDVLFTCVNLARHLRRDAEGSLRQASSKFESRFRTMEFIAEQQGLALEALDSDALDGLWRAAKSAEGEGL